MDYFRRLWYIRMEQIAIQILADAFRPEDQVITGADIDNWFTYHIPSDKDVLAYETIRASARDLARVIVTMTPICPDQTVAIRKLRECVMTANAAIACFDESTTTSKE